MANEPLPFGSLDPGTSEHTGNDVLQSVSQFNLALDRAKDRHFGPGLFGDPLWQVMQVLLNCDDGETSVTLVQIAEMIQRSVEIISRSVAILAMRDFVVQIESIPVTYHISEHGKSLLRAVFHDASSAIGIRNKNLSNCTMNF